MYAPALGQRLATQLIGKRFEMPPGPSRKSRKLKINGKPLLDGLHFSAPAIRSVPNP